MELSVRIGDWAPRGPTLGPPQCYITVRLRPGDLAPSGPPVGPLRRLVERSGGPGKVRNLRQNWGAHATRNHQGVCHVHARSTEWWSTRGGRPVQRAEEWGTWASHTRKRGEVGGVQSNVLDTCDTYTSMYPFEQSCAMGCVQICQVTTMVHWTGCEKETMENDSRFQLYSPHCTRCRVRMLWTYVICICVCQMAQQYRSM